MTQGDSCALLTRFHQHFVLWVFTVVNMGPLAEWSECLCFSKWETLGGSESPVHRHGSSHECVSGAIFFSGHCTVLCIPGVGSLPNPSTPQNGQWGFQERKEAFEIQCKFTEKFEFPKVHSSALPQEWLSLHLPFLLPVEAIEAPKSICEVSQFTRQMLTRNQAAT